MASRDEYCWAMNAQILSPVTAAGRRRPSHGPREPIMRWPRYRLEAMPDRPLSKDDPAAAAVGAPDLVTENTVPIRAGRVHGVVLNPTPRQLTNDGQVGTISVRLEDQNRNLVSGGAVKIEVSQGTVGPVQARPNGEWVATLAPPVGMRPGPIRVTATTADGQFSASTDLVVVNRTVDWTLGVRGGVLLGHGRRRLWSVSLGVEDAHQGAVCTWRLDVLSPQCIEYDPITKSAVEMEKEVYPLGLGWLPQWRAALAVLGRRTVGGLTVCSERLPGGSVSTRGWGWLPPGAGLFAGIAEAMGGEAFTRSSICFCQRLTNRRAGAAPSAVWWVPSDTSYCTD